MLCYASEGGGIYAMGKSKYVYFYFFAIDMFLHPGVEFRYASGDSRIYYHIPYGINNIKLDSAQVHRLFKGSSGGDVITFVRLGLE